MARCLAILFALVMALPGCSGGNADALAGQEQRDAAAMRGEPAAGASTADPNHSACSRAGGDWKADADQCSITATLCAATTGTWTAGTGCVVEASDETACKALAGDGGLDGFKCTQWTQGRCVLAYLAGDELASQGF